MTDLRYALRCLSSRPGFFLTVVLTLAIAMGAVTTMFSFVDAVLLKPLPFRQPDRLFAVWDSNPAGGRVKSRVSAFNYRQWKERSDVFEGLALYTTTTLTLRGSGAPIRVEASLVTADFFSLLGVEPVLGRPFQPADFEPSAPPVLLLSHRLWSGQFGADPALVGSTVALSQEPATVIGVLPRQVLPQRTLPAGTVQLGSGEHVWAPWTAIPRHHAHVFGVLAKLRDDATRGQAAVQLETIARELEQAFPDSNSGYTATLVPLVEEAVGDVETALWVLLGAVGLVLLIACVNVANLLMVRTGSRARELGLRVTLGAGRPRLLRLFLTEGAVIVGLGVALGSLLSMWGTRLLIRLNPQVNRVDEALLDARSLGAAVAVGLATAVAFALFPMARVPWRNPDRDLGTAQRTSGPGPGRSRFQQLVVAAEIALAVVLVTGAGLLLQSFRNLLSVDPGIEVDDVLVLDLALPSSTYTEMRHLTGFYDTFLAEVSSLPGVVAAAAAYNHPLTSTWDQSFLVEGAPEPAEDERPTALFRTVTPGYFATLGIGVLAGRDFAAGDDAASAGVVIVNQALARAYFPGRDPLGERLSIETTPWMWGDAIPTSFEVVGVVEDVRSTGLTAEPEPAFYVPYEQTPHHGMSVLIRSAGDPRSLLGAVRDRLRAIDPELPIAGTSDLRGIRSRLVSGPRFNAAVLTSFAAVALLLALVGLWGVAGHSARSRMHEIGVRMALGAGRASILRRLLRLGLAPVLAGLAVGLAGALALHRFLDSLLYGISSSDPLTYLVTPVALLLLSLAAWWLPARRAAAMSPMEVLRDE